MTLPNPNHHWRFDEINGRQAIDAIGGATITLDNTSFRPGKTANALRLNLANGASVVSTSLADLPPPWTASMWIKREADSASMVLFSSDDFALKLEQFPSLHTVGITRYYTGAGNSFDDGSDYTAPLNEWVHLTFVGTGADTKVYADGELKHTFPRSISLPLKWIGSRNGDSEFGSFLLDDLKVFNQALTDDHEDRFRPNSQGPRLGAGHRHAIAHHIHQRGYQLGKILRNTRVCSQRGGTQWEWGSSPVVRPGRRNHLRSNGNRVQDRSPMGQRHARSASAHSSAGRPGGLVCGVDCLRGQQPGRDKDVAFPATSSPPSSRRATSP